MEEFASTQVKDAKLQARLEKALANRKPFRNFKWEVEDSAYCEAWYAYKEAKFIEHVRLHLIDEGLLPEEPADEDDEEGEDED